MTASRWKSKTIEQMRSLDVYQDAYLPTVNALAQILERRDKVYQQFEDEGGEALVENVSDRGAVNRRINPLLVMWKDLNEQALRYWRDLGLTPAGLKRIDDSLIKKPKESALARALRDVG